MKANEFKLGYYYVGDVKEDSVDLFVMSEASKFGYPDYNDLRPYQDFVKVILLDRDLASPDDNSDYKGISRKDILAKLGFENFGIEEAGVILPIYRYSHSGDSFSTASYHDRFDSWISGFTYITRENLQLLKITDEKAKEILENTVQILDDYSAGLVYEICRVTIDRDGFVDTTTEYELAECQLSEDVYSYDLDASEHYDCIEDAIDGLKDRTNLRNFNHTIVYADDIITEFGNKSADFWEGYQLGNAEGYKELQNILKEEK